ncbi:phospholipid carrier-dependent glycosyltransferase [Candidatus Shapirobacteria bacterium]|nr:phospholipid carrier-dependent glycosyltransferase [Candidatus Shapirobacteria bacterium]
MSLKYIILFFLVLALAAFLRIYHLDRVPPHLSNDEISIAYDAYSVSKTLRDEHNHFLPVSFRSHGTYKAPLAIYLAIPTTVIFGNNEYSARLPSAILGVLTVLVIGLLVQLLTRNISLALLTSFTLAITPWHIYCSRMALESNIALFFVIFGIYLFFLSLNTGHFLLILIGFVSWAFSVYGYHTEWGFTPMIIIFLLLIYFRKIKRKPIYLLGIFLFLALTAPIFINYLNNLHSYARASTEIILKEPTLNRTLASHEFNYFQKILVLIGAVLGNYSQYTEVGYLFFDGLNVMPKNDPFQSGLFLIAFLPGFFFGLARVNKLFKENSGFIYLWAIFSPLVPTLTIGGPNLVRNLVSAVPYTIIISAGNYELWHLFKSKWVRFLIAPMFISLSFFYFAMIYYHNFPIGAAEGFQYGYKQIASYVKEHSARYQKIVIDPKFGETHNYDGVPHLYMPYFTYLDPQKFLNERKNLPSGLFFDKYEIRDIDWAREVIAPATLYVVPRSNLPATLAGDRLELIKEIRLPNNQPAFSLFGS